MDRKGFDVEGKEKWIGTETNNADGEGEREEAKEKTHKTKSHF